jgi:serine/threonine protein kinase
MGLDSFIPDWMPAHGEPGDEAVEETMIYRAPERILTARAADMSSDIYSLGGILFYMLTGLRPYAMNTVSEFLEYKQGPPPSPRHEVVNLSAETQHLVEAMMSPRPEDRPADYAELIARCDALVSSLPTKAETVREDERVKSTLATALTLAILAIIVLCTVFLSYGYYTKSTNELSEVDAFESVRRGGAPTHLTGEELDSAYETLHELPDDGQQELPPYQGITSGEAEIQLQQTGETDRGMELPPGDREKLQISVDEEQPGEEQKKEPIVP